MSLSRKTILAAALLACALPASALKTERLSPGGRFAPSGLTAGLEVVSGAACVKFIPGVSTAAAAAQLSAGGYKVQWRMPGGWYAVTLPAGQSVSQGLAALSAYPSVADVQPDNVYRVSRLPNDPYVGGQYALSLVQAAGAWEYETGTSTYAAVTVAVVDTGVDPAHPELAGRFASSVSQFCDPGACKQDFTFGCPSGSSQADTLPCAAEIPPTQACYHGTAVAGIAAALTDNSAGMAGLSWGARLVSMRIFRDGDCSDSDCGGNCATDDWAIANALNFLGDKSGTAGYGRIVANLSLGGQSVCNAAGALQSAINYALSRDVVVIAASGNGSDTSLDSPASCHGVLAVGATDARDSLASFSTYGTTMTTKGVTAPGVDIYTTNIGGAYGYFSGTSFSAPMASGLAALLWAARPGSTQDEIRNFILNSADDLGAQGPDQYFGRGRINALKAMRLAKGETLAFRGQNKAVAYPNPFRPASHRLVTFTVPQDIAGGGLDVRVYTAEGEQVRKLEGAAWDGRNEAGLPVASGVYFFRVKTDKDTAAGKFALLR